MNDDGRKSLFSHLPFVQKMLKKTENTDFEDKWKQLKDLIASTESLSNDKILLIEKTLVSLKNKLKSYEETEKAQINPPQPQKQVKRTKKKKNKKNDQEPLKSPIKIYLTNKYASMASPRREKIPPLKINMKEIHRIRTLKREKKMRKKLKLFIVRRGQSLKRELMSPPHNNVESNVNEIADNVAALNNNAAIVIINNSQKSLEASDSNLNSEVPLKSPRKVSIENLIEMHGIKECRVNLERLPEKRPNQNSPQTSSQKSPEVPRIILKKVTPKTLQPLKRNPSQNLSPILTQMLFQKSPNTSPNGSSNIQQNSTTPKRQTFKKEIDKNPPLISIPSELVMPLLHKSNEILLNADSTMRKLRPWLKSSDHQKQLNFCDNMLKNGHCLASLYKCMASACDYYTNNSFLFHQHMRIHWEYQKDDVKNFCQCPYCNFKNENSYIEYINHITESHGCARYQCSYCFYRSYDYHIVTHTKNYHSLEPCSAINCKPTRVLNSKHELDEVWKNFFSTCRPMSCVVCKDKFLSITHFEHHFQSHEKIPSSQCIKCKLPVSKETFIAHLKGCHGFGNYNCAFCKYGTDEIEILKNHMADEHANKFLWIFDRSYRTPNSDGNPKNEISKKLVVKQLIIQLSRRWNFQQPYPAFLLENAANVRNNLETYPEIKVEPNEQQEN